MKPNSEALEIAGANRLEQLEKIIHKGKQQFIEVGVALQEIRDLRLYKADYRTFEQYCRERWGWSKPYCTQIIGGAKVVNGLPEESAVAIATESQARELAKVEPQARAEIIELATAKAQSENRPMTAKDLKEAVVKMPASASKLICEECDEECDEGDAVSLYECGDCGERFTPESSADGCGHSCPSCNKWATKISNKGCPECNAGELQSNVPVGQAEDRDPECLDVKPLIQQIGHLSAWIQSHISGEPLDEVISKWEKEAVALINLRQKKGKIGRGRE